MTVSCAACPLRNRELFGRMTEDEVRFMDTFKTGEMSMSPGSMIMMEGASSPQLFTVLSGVGLRFKLLENGRRQVINFLFPGDFIGLQAGVMGKLSHNVEATTNMLLCAFQRTDLWRLFRNHPERAYDLTWVAAVEEHFLGETIASIGQRNALEKVAWALLRIYQRLEAVGMGGKGRANWPMRQQDLADALGLSLVHTNKTLAELRSIQAVTWQSGAINIPDLEYLARVGATDIEPPPVRPLI